MAERTKELSRTFHIKILMLFQRDPLSWPKHFPGPHLLLSSHWGLGFNIWILEGHTHSATIMWRLGCGLCGAFLKFREAQLPRCLETTGVLWRSFPLGSLALQEGEHEACLTEWHLCPKRKWDTPPQASPIWWEGPTAVAVEACDWDRMGATLGCFWRFRNPCDVKGPPPANLHSACHILGEAGSHFWGCDECRRTCVMNIHRKWSWKSSLSMPGCWADFGGFRSLYWPLKTMDRLVPLMSVRGQAGNRWNSQKYLSDTCVWQRHS